MRASEDHLISSMQHPMSQLIRRRLCITFAATVLSAAWGVSARAASREALAALFSQANARYQAGDFAGAEQLYLELAGKGADGGSLYYNIGNACFKQKKLGEAIYFWEKARRRLPGDPDIKENLELANLLVVDRVEVPPEPLPVRWFDSAVHMLTADQDSLVALVLFVISNIMFSAYLLATTRRAALRALALTLAGGIFCALFAGALAWRLFEKNTRQEGVVVEQKAEVRSGPGNENITVFTVHEGILVRVRGESGGWYQVNLPNGWSGWLEKDVVRVLD